MYEWLRVGFAIFGSLLGQAVVILAFGYLCDLEMEVVLVIIIFQGIGLATGMVLCARDGWRPR